MENHKGKYKWSKKFGFSSGGMALAVLFGSYIMSVMADTAREAGNSEESALLALMSIISLPAAILSVAMVAWTLFFKVPTEKTANWMKKENI